MITTLAKCITIHLQLEIFLKNHKHDYAVYWERPAIFITLINMECVVTFIHLFIHVCYRKGIFKS